MKHLTCLRTNWAATFLVTKTFHPLLAAMGRASLFWLYSLLCGAALLFVLLCVPETRARWEGEGGLMLLSGLSTT